MDWSSFQGSDSFCLPERGLRMKVVRADVLGMCFGVRDALQALEQIDRPAEVTIHGELVHNEAVLLQLGTRGFHMIGEEERSQLPATNSVLITAHGISQRERQRLEEAGKQLMDTTCPLVTRAHHAAQKLQQAGYFVVVIGRRGHVEVQGIIEDLERFEVVSRPEEVRRYPHAKLGIMCQTTTPERLASKVRRAVEEKNPQAEIRFMDTVCHPTKDHQASLERLLTEVDTMVVVGGKNSNNTKELVARCRERNIPAYHIQRAADLQAEWFLGVETVGLTAGTSTLDSTIQEVQDALVNMELPAAAT
jgi:4-hydroxy-3-methylbut-2-enyl diphosphate reductase